MSKYREYMSYRNSGNKWIDEVPSHWDVTMLKHVLSIPITDGPHSTPTFLDEGIPFVSAEAVSGGYIDFNKIRGFISDKDDEVFSQKYRPQKYDVYMIKSGATTGISAIVETDKSFNIWSPLAVMRCNSNFNPYFLLYTLRSDYFQKSVTLSWTFGTQQNIGMNTLENLTVCFPPYDEQLKIAEFLKHETAKIDTLIEKQQQLIRLLKEKRQAAISHAVTKGLNPDAPMKDSGVEWLGEVPEHWQVMRLKFLCKDIIAGPFGSSITKDMYVRDGYKVYGQEQVIPNDFRVGDYFISENDFRNLTRYKVSPGDILISCVGTFGKVAVVPNDAKPGIINPRLIRAIPKKNNDSYFLREYLKSETVFKQFELLSRGGTMGVINIAILSEIIVAVPPFEEQLDISEFISKAKQKYALLIGKAESQVHLLKERRTALISAAVTGKIDVRNWQPTDNMNTEEVEVTA